MTFRWRRYRSTCRYSRTRGLIEVEVDGRVRRCHLDAAPLGEAFGWLTRYRVFWEDRLDALAIHLEEEEQ